MVGLDNRSTMDVDATLKNLPLNEDNARKIVEEITAIHIEDGMIFEIKSVTPIMDEAPARFLTHWRIFTDLKPPRALFLTSRTESPTRNFQSSYYHRRLTFTDFFSNSLKPQIEVVHKTD